MTPLTPCTPGLNNRTPVIMSRSSNVFFPPDSPLPNNHEAVFAGLPSSRSKSTSPLATTETTTTTVKIADQPQQPMNEEIQHVVNISEQTPNSTIKIDDGEKVFCDEGEESDSELIVDMD